MNDTIQDIEKRTGLVIPEVESDLFDGGKTSLNKMMKKSSSFENFTDVQVQILVHTKDMEFIKKCLEISNSLTKELRLLRISFWNEYHAALDEKRGIKDSYIYRPVCTARSYYQHIADCEQVAFILQPIANYEVQLDEALDTGLEKLREVLDMSLYKTVEGKSVPDPMMVGKIITVTKMLDDRKHGTPTQKIDQTTKLTKKNYNMEIGESTMERLLANDAPKIMEAIEVEIKKIGKK